MALMGCGCSTPSSTIGLLRWRRGRSPTDPDHALPEQLPSDEVWSRLDRVLQLKPKENVDGKPGPLNSSVVSKLVCSPLYSVFFSPFLSCFLSESPVS